MFASRARHGLEKFRNVGIKDMVRQLGRQASALDELLRCPVSRSLPSGGAPQSQAGPHVAEARHQRRDVLVAVQRGVGVGRRRSVPRGTVGKLIGWT
jgi:hypothetical protein